MAFKRRSYKFYPKRAAIQDGYRHRIQRPRPLSLGELFYLIRYSASFRQAVYQAHRNDQSPSAAHTPKQALLDPHAVLGIPKTASKEEITEAYRKMAKQHHPDTVGPLGPEKLSEAERIMKVINEAYAILRK